MADLKEAVRKGLLFLDFKGKMIILTAEQENALYSLLEGNNVLAVLPTGFGKAMIFTRFSVAARERTPEAVSVLVMHCIAAQQHNHHGKCVTCHRLAS